MGEFDDVLAMELGDEWDDVSWGDAEDDPELPAVVATLRVPGAVVELRGEAPDVVLDSLRPLQDERLRSGEAPRRVPLVVTRAEAGWTVEGPPSRPAATVDTPDLLLNEVVAHLDAMVLAADRGELHLEVSCVEFDGVGVVVAAERPEDRRAVTSALLELGASLVSDRILTALPGSHTVFGYPAPHDESIRRAAAPVSPHTAVDVVAFVRRQPSGMSGAITQLPMVDSVVRLMGLVIDRKRFGAAALDVVATLAAGATHAELVGPDAVTVARAILAIEPPPRRVFSVVHRFADLSGSASDGAHGAPSLRVACFDDGSVAFDSGTGQLVVLEVAEVDALEELLVRSQGSKRKRRGADPRLNRLIGLGVHVPDSQRRPVPGPEAYGLPNCPAGETARSMWADRARASRPGEAVVSLDGITALAMLRGAVPGDDEWMRAALDQHRRVQDDVVNVERHLLHALGVLSSRGLDPLVLGSVVEAHDGSLPPYFAEYEQVDLFVHDGQLAGAVAALEAAGYERIRAVGVEGAEPGDHHPAEGTGDGGTGGGGTDASTDPVGAVDLQPVGQPASGITVRVRESLSVGPFRGLVDHEEFHRRSVPVRIHGRWCKSLHPEHRFVHACVQVDNDRDAPSAQLVRDVVLAAPRADALMSEALEASERWGATATVTSAVRQVDAMVPGLSPWVVDRSAKGSGGGRLGRRRSRRSR